MRDKAIDVLDEAGARIRLRSMTKPPNLAELEEQIELFSIQKDEAVKNAEYEEAAKLRDQAEALRAKKEDMQLQWRENAKEIDGVVDEEVIAEVVNEEAGLVRHYTVELPAGVTELPVPRTFFKEGLLLPGTEFRLEVIAIEDTGTKTITEGTFQVPSH